MKKLLTFLLVILTFSLGLNAQNTLKISSNRLEMITTSTGKGQWVMANVSKATPIGLNKISVSNGSTADREIDYTKISFIKVGSASPVAPYSFDSLYTIIANNISSVSDGGSGGSFDGQLTQNGLDVSEANPLPVNQNSKEWTTAIVGLNQFSEFEVSGYSTLMVEVSGTLTGTLSFTASGGDNFPQPIYGFPVGSPNTSSGVTSVSAVGGKYLFNVSGLKTLTVTATAFTSGAVTLYARAVNGGSVPINITQQVSVTGNVSLGSSSSLAGDVGFQYRTSVTGAASVFSVLSPAVPSATQVKGGSGRLIGLSLVNTAATLRSVKFFNVATGSVNLGTTSAVFEIDIAPGQRVDFNLPGGTGFNTAITIAITGAKGLSDNTGGLTVNDVSGVIFYM